MGYIDYHNGRLKNSDLYVGWVDFKTGEPASDGEVKKRTTRISSLIAEFGSSVFSIQDVYVRD